MPRTTLPLGYLMLLVIAITGCTTPPPGTSTDPLRWTRQFGTTLNDLALAIAADADSNVYVAGGTTGTLAGASAGSQDAFVRSYDQSGTLRWTRQFGTIAVENVRGIATDTNGNVFTTGSTQGELEGANAGTFDAFVRAYDQSGTLLWTRQFGTTGSDQGWGIAVDPSGNIYVAGYTYGDLDGTNAGVITFDAFIRSYNQSGGLRWASQFGTSGNDYLLGITTDAAGNVYATGYTEGALEGVNAGAIDGFIRSYTQGGGLRWTRQFGTSGNDFPYAIAADASGNVYTTGTTDGVLAGTSAGSSDAFIRSYDQSGALRWTRQFGTPTADVPTGITADTGDNVFVTGHTFGNLDGTNAGGFTSDAFVRSYDPDGTLVWARQFGTGTNDTVQGIAANAAGYVYVAGYTDGAFEGTNAGGNDAFVRSYEP